jgi:hypothetical protein
MPQATFGGGPDSLSCEPFPGQSLPPSPVATDQQADPPLPPMALSCRPAFFSAALAPYLDSVLPVRRFQRPAGLRAAAIVPTGTCQDSTLFDFTSPPETQMAVAQAVSNPSSSPGFGPLQRQHCRFTQRGFYLPASFRPQAFSASRRFTPGNTSGPCCIPQALVRFPPSGLSPLREAFAMSP